MLSSTTHLTHVVGDMHDKTSVRSTALPMAHLALLGSEVYLLTDRVLDGVSVTRLPVHEN